MGINDINAVISELGFYIGKFHTESSTDSPRLDKHFLFNIFLVSFDKKNKILKVRYEPNFDTEEYLPDIREYSNIKTIQYDILKMLDDSNIKISYLNVMLNANMVYDITNDKYHCGRYQHLGGTKIDHGMFIDMSPIPRPVKWVLDELEKYFNDTGEIEYYNDGMSSKLMK